MAELDPGAGGPGTIYDARTVAQAGSGASVQSYTLPPGLLQYVQAVYVEVDNSGGPDIKPTLSISEQAGVVIARKQQGKSIDAGATGSATWALRLDDEGGGIESIVSPQQTINVQNPFGPIVSIDVKTGFGMGAYIQRSPASGAQSINPNAGTLGIFTEVEWASPGMVDLATHPTRITIPVDGMYHVTGATEWATLAGDTDARRIFVLSNPLGGPSPQQSAIYRQDALNFYISVADVLRLTAGMFLTLETIQRAGGARVMFPRLGCQWVGPLV